MCLLGFAASGIARADIYAMTDPEGTVKLTDIPDDSRYRLMLREFPADAPANRTALRTSARARVTTFDGHVRAAAQQYGVEPALVHAVIAAESSYNPTARSPKGALGLMQVMPDTGRRYGVALADLADPATNIRTGTRYLSELLRLFSGNLPLAVASYNAGEQAVMRHGDQVPPYAETQAYVPRVLKDYAALRMSAIAKQ
jgi:soluble lytic murein transglycosylase-like protein